MKEILMSKAESCQEFRDALIESRDKKLVETVKSDRFWSCGLTPLEAQTTKPMYYTGENNLGRSLELVRAHLIKQLENSKSYLPATSQTMQRSNSLPLHQQHSTLFQTTTLVHTRRPVLRHPTLM